jgi:5'-methylthioadenosine phosphorylase
MTKIGIIGGTGLDDPKILKDFKEIEVETPYGRPSSPLTIGTINGKRIIIISRHGRKHQFSPTFVNNRANIWALKQEGVEYIIATTACGSLREEIARGDFVIPDQFIDFTKYRKTTFFEENFDVTQHTPMGEPFSNKLRNILINTAKKLGLKVHERGTVVTIEGPRFSTRAESRMFRILGADIINMSTAPECILANELKIPYAVIAMSTDYDSWKEGEHVKWEDIKNVLDKNTENVKKLLIEVIKEI